MNAWPIHRSKTVMAKKSKSFTRTRVQRGNMVVIVTIKPIGRKRKSK